MRQKRKAYAGVLAKPVVAPPFKQTLLSDGLEEGAWRRAIMDQWEARWAALFDHYGIVVVDESSFKTLAAALAKDWVPGFALAAAGGARGKRGAPSGRGFEANKRAFVAVETLRAKRPSLSTARLCSRAGRELGADAKTVRNRYDAFVRHYCGAARSDKQGEAMKAMLVRAFLSSPVLTGELHHAAQNVTAVTPETGIATKLMP